MPNISKWKAHNYGMRKNPLKINDYHRFLLYLQLERGNPFQDISKKERYAYLVIEKVKILERDFGPRRI